jgi:4-hydroxy-3-methylbut-2-en-1-yl diphosphate reductase
MSSKRVILVSPRGFCAGVRRAVEITEAALQVHAPPIYCHKEIVHNRQIVEGLRRKGVVFVSCLAEVPPGGTVIFSAHGVPPSVRDEATRRTLKVIDATCPFVTKVHSEVKRYAGGGYTIILLGHARHDEIVGIRGEAPEHVTVIENKEEAAAVRVADPAKVAAVTQTTLSVEETGNVMAVLRSRFPQLITPPEDDICYATLNRQKAVRALAEIAGIILVLGSESSSNSLRLVEVARAGGAHAHLVSAINALADVPLAHASVVGLTAGASTPETFIQEVVAALGAQGFARIEEMRIVEEDVHFPLPPELRRR